MGMPLTHRRFTVDEYYRMAETGILGPDDRVELLDGEIVEMSPIGPRHAATVSRLQRLFERLGGDRTITRVQSPVRLHRYCEPEPDVALVVARDDFYGGAHPAPADILLIVEVADTTLAYDRRKLASYAQASVPEVWLVDLTADRIAVHTGPHGDTYADVSLVGPDATLTPRLLPGIALQARDILPRDGGPAV